MDRAALPSAASPSVKWETSSYKEPRQEQEVGEGGIAHYHEGNRDHHQFRSVHKEDEEDDIDVFLCAIDEVLKGAEFGRGGGALILQLGIVLVSKEVHFGFLFETILL